MAYIEFRNVHKSFGNNEVLKGINLSIDEGEFVTLLGPSGCGKSTLLRCFSGLETVTEGEIYLDGTNITDFTPKQRKIGMVFQQYSLFPNMTVRQNVAFGLQMQKKDKHFIAEKVKDVLHTVGLSDKLDQYPRQLSGGQQQRVALARALVLEPGVLLFDEPLSNLDAKLRVSMRTEIRRIQQATGITAIYVTHDQSEAMALSDSIIIMNKGVVAQIGSPQEIYYHPNSEFVADFIGEANFLKGKCVALEDGCGVLQLADTQVRVAATENMTLGEDYTIVLRPESAGLVPEGNLKCRVVLSCFMGAYQNYHVMVGDTLVKLTDYNPKNHRIYQVGETCALTFEPDGVHVL